MESRLEWLSEEEGQISFYDEKKLFLTVQVFVTGEEEAEFRLQDIVFPENKAKSYNMCREVISKMTRCVSKSFRLLWEEGFEETTLVEHTGTKLAEILDSTKVVRLAYKEYMMKRHFSLHKSTDCGLSSLNLTKTEDGYTCENEEKTFFCRLLNYESTQPEEVCFYLYEVEVKKKKRNKGIATACLTELFRRLCSQSAVTIYLQVGSYNEPAVHLYEKLGFAISEALCYYTMTEE